MRYIGARIGAKNEAHPNGIRSKPKASVGQQSHCHLMQRRSPLLLRVEVGLTDIEISDDQEAGGTVGNIISIIYKGDHYQYIVRTEENEEDYVFDSPDLWNENDYVSIKIKPENIRLRLKQEIK